MSHDLGLDGAALITELGGHSVLRNGGQSAAGEGLQP